MKKINVGLVGATGAVGQKFIELLIDHPWFNLVKLAGSGRSSGKKYGEVTEWHGPDEVFERVKNQKVVASTPEGLKGVKIVFSAIPADVAKPIEGGLARAGHYVFSNTRSYRMEKDVPLLITEVNPEHFKLLEEQKKRGWKGAIITNPNCSVVQLCLALKPIQDQFGIKQIIVSTMQALSGAGYPGVPSMMILDNVIPYIDLEEGKMESEPLKILGKYNFGKIEGAKFSISSSCHRVAVSDSHLEDVHISLEKKATVAQIKKVLSNFKAEAQKLKLPSAPKNPIVVREENDRPQPIIDRYAGRGMTVTVGRVREDSVLENGIKMEVLGHNTVRGATGCSILNVEYFVKKFKM